jgi:hypothetical protein
MSVGTLTTLRTGNAWNRPSISRKDSRYLPSLSLPNLLWFPSSLLFNVYWKRLLKQILQALNQKTESHPFHKRSSPHIWVIRWMFETKIITNKIQQYATVIYWLWQQPAESNIQDKLFQRGSKKQTASEAVCSTKRGNTDVVNRWEERQKN